MGVKMCPSNASKRGQIFLILPMLSPGIRERDLLMDHFLADGMDQRAYVLEFLPACVQISA